MLFSVDVRDFEQWRRGLRELAADMPDVVEDVEEQVAELVADVARPLVPRRSGAARSSVKALEFTGTWSTVGGNASVPYFTWLNWGGRAGRSYGVLRPKVREGRYLWPAYEKSEQDVEDVMQEELMRALRKHGLA